MAERRPLSRGCTLVAVVVAVLGMIAVGIGSAIWDGLSGRTVATDAPKSRRVLATRRDASGVPGPGPGCSEPLRVVSALQEDAGIAPPSPPVPESAEFPEEVEIIAHLEAGLGPPLSLGTVPLGTTLDLGDLPCHHIDFVSAEHRGLRVGKAWRRSSNALNTLAIGPLQQVIVRVEDALTGEPISGAWTETHRIDAHQRTGADGELTWWRPTLAVDERVVGPVWEWRCDALHPEVHAEGYVSQRITVPGCNGAQGRGGTAGLETKGMPPIETTVAMESGRTVFVHCLRDGKEECPGDLTCTPSWSVQLDRACRRVPSGFGEERENALRCACPHTDAVVRGLGRSYAVPDDTDDIWIDLEGAAGVRGTVADYERRRHSCRVVAERVAADLEDIGSLGAVGRVEGQCDRETGDFELTGLAEGDWVVEVTRRSHERDGQTDGIALPVPALEPDELRDLGEVDPTRGSAVEVECEDGVTGETTRSPIVLMLHDSDDFEVGFVQVVSCGHRLDPALAGDWDLFVLPWAHVRESVHVGPGDDRTVRLVIGDDDAVEALGGVLEPGGDGLVVRWVEPGGALDVLGVQPGDALIDIAAFGMPLPMDDYPEAVLSGVLGVWGTSGVEVAVESGETGEVRWIDLDP